MQRKHPHKKTCWGIVVNLLTSSAGLIYLLGITAKTTDVAAKKAPVVLYEDFLSEKRYNKTDCVQAADDCALIVKPVSMSNSEFDVTQVCGDNVELPKAEDGDMVFLGKELCEGKLSLGEIDFTQPYGVVRSAGLFKPCPKPPECPNPVEKTILMTQHGSRIGCGDDITHNYGIRCTLTNR